MKTNKELILAYDFGTSGVKTCVFDIEGNLLFKSFCECSTYLSRDSWAEQDSNDWWNSVIVSTRELLKAGLCPEELRAIGISGHMMGCLPVDEKGMPLRRSMIHSDKRSKLQCAQLEERLGSESIYEITGNRYDPRYSICKLMWFKEDEPDLYEKTSLFLQCKEYIVFKLTGVLGYTDYSDASLAGYLDIKEKRISDKIITAAGLDMKKLPQVVASSTVVGHVSQDAADLLGLPKGIPVVIGGGDGACASVGAGAVDDGEAYNYLGSTSWINVVTSAPLMDPNRRIFHLYSLDPNKLNLGGAIQTAGSAYQWAKEQLGQVETVLGEQLGENPFELLNRAAALVKPGSDGLIFLPYLMGEKTPIWDPKARGIFFGLSLSHTKNHMIRSVLEGVGYALRSVIESFEELGVQIEEMNLTGGATKGDLWPKILADIFGKPILIDKYASDAPALGAAFAAGIGCGWYSNFKEVKRLIKTTKKYKPDKDAGDCYTKYYSIYKGLYHQLKPSYNKLAEIREE